MATIVEIAFIPVSVPYVRAEVSSLVHRLGVTDILVRATSEDGRVGWGESASGANVESVLEALQAMKPFVLGKSCWESESIRAELWKTAIWQYRKPTACFAFAGIDMALWDLAGKECHQPIYRLFGGKVRDRVNYYCYLEQGTPQHVGEQGRKGLANGYTVFYLKVGIDVEQELEMVKALREAVGPRGKIRLDANGAWHVNEALRILKRFDQYEIDFVEQPVSQDPVSNMQEVRARSPVALSANEGMWSAEDAYRQIGSRVADVYCFSPYWVGSLAEFQKLSMVAHYEGLRVCRHSHGELGIAAAAFHHICLTLPNLVDGNQQTAQIMSDDVLRAQLPISTSPNWGVIEEPGIGLEVDEDKVHRYHELYLTRGQFLPYARTSLEIGETQHA
jgi:L-alanine-DL-glutamate epimerase-like enolase superfamily enzyme